MIEIILNPEAGSGRALKACEVVTRELKERGVKFILHRTNHPHHATELARSAAERGVETVIALGGDGTLNETVAGLHGSQTALGIIPCGTGNDFIKSAGIPLQWTEAVDFILSHPPRPVNAGHINNQVFLNECGTGFDVMALDFAQQAKKYVKGIWPYLYGVVRSIIAFKPVQMHIEIGDEITLDGKYLVCAVGNGTYIGGGIPITPGADLTDGLFDVLVVDAVPRWRIPFYLPSLLMGTLHKKTRVAHRYLASKCLIRCDNMRMNLDGEIRPMDEARFTCAPSSLLLHW